MKKSGRGFCWRWWIQHFYEDAAIDAQFGQNGIWTEDAESWRFSKCFLYQKTLTLKPWWLDFFIMTNLVVALSTRILNHCQLTWKPSRCSVTSCDDAIWTSCDCGRSKSISVLSIVGSQTLSNLKRPIYIKRCFSGGNGPRICQHFRWIHASYSTGELTQKSTVTWKLLPQASSSRVRSHLKKMRSQKGKNHYL